MIQKSLTQAIRHFGTHHNDKRLDHVIDDMQTDIDSRALNSDLNKNHTLGSGVNIKTYTSSNRYTCPSDGYVRAVHYGRSSGYVKVRIESENASNYTQFTVFANSQDDAYETVFVRKGLKVYPSGNSGDFTLAFIPIE